jgi:hypothetical protein
MQSFELNPTTGCFVGMYLRYDNINSKKLYSFLRNVLFKFICLGSGTLFIANPESISRVCRSLATAGRRSTRKETARPMREAISVEAETSTLTTGVLTREVVLLPLEAAPSWKLKGPLYSTQVLMAGAEFEWKLESSAGSIHLATKHNVSIS